MKKSLRKFKKKIFIICEGETEICYFQSLKSLYHGDLRNQIEPIGPCIKLQTSISGNRECFYFSRKKEILKKTKIGTSQSERKKYIEKVYIIVDIDDHQSSNHYDRNTIDQMIKFFTSKGWEILFSNRNIETFIHSHFNYSESTNDRLSDIQKRYPGYDKGNNFSLQDIHKQIIKDSSFKNLKNNMQKLQRYHNDLENNHIYTMNPYSQVTDIITKLGF